MGNFCTCKVFLHQKDEANMDEMKGTDGVNSNRPIEIISQYSQLSSMNKEKLLGKADKIKNNLEKKLPEIGTYISENEFKSLINDNINEYMEKNKLNFQKYISPNISTFAANPIKFKNNNVYLGNWNINTEMEGYGMYYCYHRRNMEQRKYSFWKNFFIKWKYIRGRDKKFSSRW